GRRASWSSSSRSPGAIPSRGEGGEPRLEEAGEVEELGGEETEAAAAQAAAGWLLLLPLEQGPGRTAQPGDPQHGVGVLLVAAATPRGRRAVAGGAPRL